MAAFILLTGFMIAIHASPVTSEPMTRIQVKPVNIRAQLPKPEVKPQEAIGVVKQIKTFRVTAYTGIDRGESGKDLTASGAKAVPYQTVAASPDLPFGTVLTDAKTGHHYIVEDRGGAIKGNSLDLYVGHSNVKEALKFGVQYLTLEIEK